MLSNFNYRDPVTKSRINMGLGTYPELSLANARKKVIETRELLAQGIDPKVQRKADNEANRAQTEHTLGNVATACLELKKHSVTTAYAEDIWRSLTLHVFPSLKNTPLKDVTAPMIIKLPPHRGQRQLGDSQATFPTPQRNNGLRRQLRIDLCEPTEWHPSGIRSHKSKHADTSSRRTTGPKDCACQRQHQTHHPLPDRMATAHRDPPSRGCRYDLDRNLISRNASGPSQRNA